MSNTFYEWVLGPSMTYTCACFPQLDSTLEEAQANKYDLVARKLALQPGMRLLDVGCGWGGMVRHAAKNYGVKALGVTLSREQAEWAQAAIEREGLSELAEVRFMDYRDVREGGFDAISSIGLTEHIGVKNYPAYFPFLQVATASGRTAAEPLHHASGQRQHDGITRGGFIDRYVFPDGELAGSGHIITVMQDTGLEVRHEESLREHYAMTLRDWCRNLREHWDEAVEEVGRGYGAGLGPVHGRLPTVVRAQPDPAAPGARREHPDERRRGLPAAPGLGLGLSLRSGHGRGV